MMKRTPGFVVFASLAMALSLVACDAMFSNNLFAGLTHKELTADSIDGQSPSEIKEAIDSDYAMDQLEEDPALKEAVLDELGESFDTTEEAETSEGQTAAILAADILIQTDPAASQLIAGAVGAIEDVIDLADGAGAMTDEEMAQAMNQIIADILPLSIQDELSSGSTTPPQDFVDMIESLLAANEIYGILNEAIGSDGYDASVTDAEMSEIAMNAIVAGFVGILDTDADPTNELSGEDLAQALWSALIDPDNASSYITVSGSAFDELAGASGVGNLLDAAGLSFGE